MNRSLVALWVTLIAAIAMISFLAVFWNRQRTENSQQRVRQVLRSQLEPLTTNVRDVVDGYRIALERESSDLDLADLDDCVNLSRSPLVHALIVIDDKAALHFPRDGNLSTDRQTLVDEALQVLREHMPSGQSDRDEQLASDESQIASDARPRASSGLVWQTWYHRRGIVLGLGLHQVNKFRGIVALPRSRWMADIIAALPEQESDLTKLSLGKNERGQWRGSLKQLVDVEGNVIYQWGDVPQADWEEMQLSTADAEVALYEPLEGWRIRTFATEELRQAIAGDDFFWLPLFLAVAGLSASLLLVGVLVTINLNRQMRLAAGRVSFVNQVSHELRTPLTNICIYADLLKSSLEGSQEMSADDSPALQRLSVIQSESRRLSRLIANVLEFARPESNQQPLRLETVVLDDVVRDVLATFRAKLQQLGFEIDVTLNTPEKRRLDPGAVEQILVNLIGNAEKYAAEGGQLEIRTEGFGNQVAIEVQDFGPGIPSRYASQIFEPFMRISDRLEDPAGTGIGLTIARDLARKHGGDCTLVDSQVGARFRCQLTAEAIG